MAVLLSTWNGERYLPEQLASLAGQLDADWTLLWRDDGSADETVTVLEAFAASRPGRCVRPPVPEGRLGAPGSFFALLREAPPDLPVAFADQDDVWLPERLARGLDSLARCDPSRPALYCARQRLVDSQLRPLGLSAELRRPPGFPTALTQNIATGCTMMLNPAATRLVASSTPPAGTLHDWWCYLVVAAAGGALVVDETPSVLYRQHGGNAVGAPHSLPHRGVAALRRGPAPFMALLRAHVASLRAQPHLLSTGARAQLEVIDAALAGGMLRRLRALRLPGLARQTWQETLLFRLWFVLG